MTTTPGRKDNRPASAAVETLIGVYAAAPARLSGALAGLSDHELAARPIDDKWSIQEIVFHLADSELMAAARFRQAISGSHPTFAYYSQDIWAEKFDYRHADRRALEEAVDLFAALRAATTRLLRRLSGDQWALTGHHPERGPLSVRQILETYANHGENHVKQILERRRLLGKPLDLAPLTPGA
ncbi:MAG TPA: DinB family protein [candidate division Zixibacteria bacterium]|nr:DinB family protein [candidate division Zixibacteria bacterium]MDD4916371.1 DinB family protein [candidate division Zixibacteria bacterium]MDM7972831.1 DinB family protein [candidate division Zixibacteria bacterium]HOD66607.1 DinB family protein [candidate division Zixibacteria bacterium]HOZ08477.1 DinB family protein [candidate division Zixibacteria bacterium]